MSAYKLIANPQSLEQYCRDLETAEEICFDTEFVSEHTYRSELCLVQVAVNDELAIIDPLAVRDLTPFWQTITRPGHRTIVHAGREELNFCLHSTDNFPHQLFDTQIAAGLVSSEYPAGYSALLNRFLNVKLEKGETRTDWRRRPLSKGQLEYALDDVRHLSALGREIGGKLDQLNRRDWLHAEMAEWQQEVDAYRKREQWPRLPGINGLNRRALGILRELWRWRDDYAAIRNIPSRRILRDDLLVELAKRRSTDPKQIQAVRGMERGDIQRILPDLIEAVRTGLALPEDQLPQLAKHHHQPQQFTVLGQLLSTALGSLCRQQQVAAALVGTAGEVRDLIAYRLGHLKQPPSLAVGWREQVVGRLIEDLLEGRLTVRVGDPQAEDPLVFEPITSAK